LKQNYLKTLKQTKQIETKFSKNRQKKIETKLSKIRQKILKQNYLNADKKD